MSGRFRSQGPYYTPTMEQMEIVSITPVEDRFLDRWKGWVDLGFSLTKANDFTQWTLGSEFTYRPELYQFRAKVDSLYSSQTSSARTFHGITWT